MQTSGDRSLIVNIDLEDDVLKKVDAQAEKEERSRKKMLELMIKRSVNHE